MPKAWCYARASHADQYAKKADGVDICNTVDRQVEACQRYWEYQLQPQGIEWGGFEAEKHAVSATKTRFIDRPAAIRLLAKMQPGDHLIFDKVDRMWRRLSDYVKVDEVFKSRGISMHIVNMMGSSITRGTPMGDFILGLFVLLAQMESQQLSDRIKANCAWRKARGLANAKRKRGFKVQGPAKSRVYVPDLEERAIMQEIVRLRDSGLKLWEISDEIEKKLCAAEGKPYKHLKFVEWRKDKHLRRWPCNMIADAYQREKELQAEGL